LFLLLAIYFTDGTDGMHACPAGYNYVLLALISFALISFCLKKIYLELKEVRMYWTDFRQFLTMVGI